MTSSTAILQQAQQAVSQEALCVFALRFRQKRSDVNLYSTVLTMRETEGAALLERERNYLRARLPRPVLRRL